VLAPVVPMVLGVMAVQVVAQPVGLLVVRLAYRSCRRTASSVLELV
jgi:hypothetical protein